MDQLIEKYNFYYQNGSLVHLPIRGGNLLGAELHYNNSQEKRLHR